MCSGMVWCIHLVPLVNLCFGFLCCALPFVLFRLGVGLVCIALVAFVSFCFPAWFWCKTNETDK